MRTLRHRTDEHKGGEAEKYKNREGDKTEETLKYGEQRLPEGSWEGDGLNG